MTSSPAASGKEATHPPPETPRYHQARPRGGPAPGTHAERKDRTLLNGPTLLPLLTVFAAVTIILFFVTGGLRTKATGGNKRLGQLSGPGQAPGFPSALVASAAAATALSATGAEPFSTGALLGAICAAVGTGALTPLRKVLYAAAGITGTITTLTTNLTPVPGCIAPGALGLWFTILLASIAVLAAAAGWLISHTPTSPLAFFSALSVITFLASPLGVPAFDTTNPALTAGVGIAAAAIFGYTAGRWPAPITGLAALTITLTTIGTAAFIVPACQNALNGQQAYALIAFTAVYTLINVSVTPFRRKTRD